MNTTRPTGHLPVPFRRLLLLTILLLVGIPDAVAYVRRFTPEGDPYRVDFDYTPVLRYHLAATTSVRGVVSNEWNNVRAAFDQWQSLPGTRIRFEEGSPSPSLTTIPIEDGRIDVHWVSPGAYSVPALGGTVSLQAGQIASAWFVDDGTGVVLQAVVLVNRDLDMLTDYESDSATRPFLESVLLHEIGHVLGLNHAVLGGATLWWFQGGGVGTAAGLSTDERAFAAAAYGTAGERAGRGRIAGTVRRSGGSTLPGALVTVTSDSGEVLAATATRSGGAYELDGIPEGPVRIGVRPLDPDSPSDAYLIRGREIDVSSASEYASVPIDYAPSAPVSRQVTAGGTVTADFEVSGTAPTWRMVEIRSGLAEAGRASSDAGLVLPVGTVGGWVGVYVSGPVPADALLSVTGPGLQTGSTRILPGALRQLTLVQAPVTVDPGAPPGLRSIEVAGGGLTRVAPGFVEIRSTQPDFDFDGLDDRFQRRYFAPFTRPEAAPEEDPDGDGFPNRREALAGSDPLDPASVFFRILVPELAGDPLRLRVETAPGRRYEVIWSSHAGGLPTVLGAVFTASGEISDIERPRPPGDSGLIWIRQLP